MISSHGALNPTHSSITPDQRNLDHSRKVIDHYRALLKADPDDEDLWLKLGDAMLSERWNPSRFNLGMACYRKSLTCRADNPRAYCKMSRAMKRMGKQEEALALIQKALDLDSDFLPARFAMLDLLCPVLYEDENDIARWRAAYEKHLEGLCETFDDKNPDDLQHASDVVGEYPFHLAYQGYNDCDVQRKFGSLICRIQEARYPQWSRPIPLTPLIPGERLRIGIVSGFFRFHATWNFPTHGLLTALDRNRFSLYGYHTGKKNDANTDLARNTFDRFVENDFSLESLCENILSHRLHLLLYPEIGMNRLTLRLASLRLAPVQCVSWGHSTTSGLPTMDYFVSSDLMEPDDGSDHYTETLIRIPNIGVYYPPPRTETTWMTRKELGFKDDDVLYLCLQSLFKYLPQHDDLFARIARAVPNSRFVFTTGRMSGSMVNVFRNRLARAFARHGLQSDNHTVLLPYLEDRAYYSLYHTADAFLDSVGWSGCNTTLDAVARHLPVVTFPGPLMRGRQSQAILKRMDVTDTLATSLADYVAIAARLGQDKPWQNDIRRRIAENKHRIYADTTAMDAMERFFERAVAGSQQAQGGPLP